MNNKRILELENELNSLNKRILEINKELNDLKSNNLKNEIKFNEENDNLFGNFIVNVKKDKEVTVGKYLNALRVIRDDLNDIYNLNIDYNLWRIDDSKEFKKLIDLFESNADLVIKNRNRHYDLSAAYNNFYAFLKYKESNE